MLLVAAAPTLVEATDSFASDSPAAGQASASALPAVPYVALDPLAGIVTGRPIRAGFVGLSLEFPAVPAYAGADPASINPVLVRLIRQLTPGASPVLRIGGDSTDWTWLPVRGASPPAITSYRLTPAWIRTTRSLVDAIGGRLILGVNLAMLRPALAGAEGRAFTAGIGASRVAAFEIGNEADVYRSFPRYRNAVGAAIHVRNHSYTFGSFTHEFSRIRRVLPDVPTAGPAFGNLTWMKHLRGFLASEPGLGIVTFHRYPLSCFARPGSPKHASIANLMTTYASRGLARTVAGFVTLAHARGLRFRVDELNSVSCGGVRGVSDTFASALWALDTLFELAKVGVDGVNVHTLPGVAYEPFSFTRQQRPLERVRAPHVLRTSDVCPCHAAGSAAASDRRNDAARREAMGDRRRGPGDPLCADQQERAPAPHPAEASAARPHRGARAVARTEPRRDRRRDHRRPDFRSIDRHGDALGSARDDGRPGGAWKLCDPSGRAQRLDAHGVRGRLHGWDELGRPAPRLSSRSTAASTLRRRRFVCSKSCATASSSALATRRRASMCGAVMSA